MSATLNFEMLYVLPVPWRSQVCPFDLYSSSRLMARCVEWLCKSSIDHNLVTSRDPFEVFFLVVP